MSKRKQVDDVENLSSILTKVDVKENDEYQLILDSLKVNVNDKNVESVLDVALERYKRYIENIKFDATMGDLKGKILFFISMERNGEYKSQRGFDLMKEIDGMIGKLVESEEQRNRRIKRKK